jgi:hypothetical protein
MHARGLNIVSDLFAIHGCEYSIFANPFCALVLVESEWIRKPTNLIQICGTIHRVNTERQIATFWRTFQNDGKISPAW